MIGSAVQNVITLTDTYFLARYSDISFAAIGIVGIFYLMITTIGYNFTKAGQIIIARRMGEGDEESIGRVTYSMLGFILLLSGLFFFVTKWLTPLLFPLFLHDPAILQACDDYLQARSWGIFFSYSGMVVIALYTGIARPMVIIYNAIALGVVNAVLNYALIFGHWGFPELGMAGAAWASSISEVVATAVFLLYMLLDKRNRAFGMFGGKARARWQAEQRESFSSEPLDAPQEAAIARPFIDWGIIRQQIALSTPIIFQSVVGIGSWLVFFFAIENMGRQALEVSTLIRSVYMMFMIPAWGFGSGINTIVSNLIGKQQHNLVIASINRTALLCFSITMLCALWLIAAPSQVLGIISTNSEIIEASMPMIGIFVLILAIFSTAAIYFNGIIGTGATQQSLWMQMFGCVLYLVYAYVAIKIFEVSLPTAWGAELVYWGVTLLLSLWYLRSNRWLSIRV